MACLKNNVSYLFVHSIVLKEQNKVYFKEIYFKNHGGNKK